MSSNFPINPKIFRAYDIRGIVGEDITADTTYWLARAFAAELIEQQQSACNLAWDGRLSSPELAENFQRGLLDAGIQVNSLGAQPTGLLYFSTYFLDCPNGVMITGSHNPIQYNGFKPVIQQLSIDADTIQRLYQRIVGNQLPVLPAKGELKQLDISQDYVARLMADIQLQRPLKIVVDAGNGIGGPAAKQLFDQLGVSATYLYCDVDGRFPNHHPDPGVPANIAELRATVLAEQADLGLAFDGDADRVALVDSQANIIWPDRLLMLLCQDVLPHHPQAKVIYDVKSTGYLPKLVRQLGGEPMMTATGHSIMKRELKRLGALLGGEFSGHLYIQHRWYGFDDGLYAAVRLLEVLTKFSASSAEVLATIPEEVSTPEITLDVDEQSKFAIIDALQNYQPLLAQAQVYTVDGLRLEFADGWGLIRASNTTPKLTLRFAGESAQAIANMQQQFKAALAVVAPKLALTF